MRPTELLSLRAKAAEARIMPLPPSTSRRDSEVSMASRRNFTKALAAVPAVASISAYAQRTNGDGNLKVLRYAFRIAEPDCDPAQVNDFYSSSINGTFSTRLWRTTSSRAPPNCAQYCRIDPEVSSDFTQLTVRIRPPYLLPRPSGLQRSEARAGRTRLRLLDQRFYHPKFIEPTSTLLDNARFWACRIRAAALKGANSL